MAARRGQTLPPEFARDRGLLPVSSTASIQQSPPARPFSEGHVVALGCHYPGFAWPSLLQIRERRERGPFRNILRSAGQVEQAVGGTGNDGRQSLSQQVTRLIAT